MNFDRYPLVQGRQDCSPLGPVAQEAALLLVAGVGSSISTWACVRLGERSAKKKKATRAASLKEIAHAVREQVVILYNEEITVTRKKTITLVKTRSK